MMDDSGDDQATVAPIKRGPGRPRKPVVEREPLREAHRENTEKPVNMRAKPNWENIDPNASDTPDRLRIDPSLIPEGMSLQWVTSTIYGQETRQRRSGFESKGWTPVHQEDFDGQFDGMFMAKGETSEITVDGLVLMARPEHLTRAAQRRDKLNAMKQVQIKEHALHGGDIGVTAFDAQHPSALRSNKVNKTMERIEVPED